MAHYIDGFVLPVPRRHLENYRRLAEATARIWMEYGALDYREFVGDDLVHEGTGSFIGLSGASADEVVVFGWVLFESREARDEAGSKVAADPRMPDLMNSLGSGFDAARMAYGGFREFVSSSDSKA